MPIEYRLLHELNLVLVRCTGNLVTEDILKYAGQLASDPNYRKGMNELILLNKINSYEVNFEELQLIADNELDLEPDLMISKTVFVTRDPQVIGKLAVYETFASKLKVKFATLVDLGEAAEWLKIDYQFIKSAVYDESATYTLIE